jgi:hypothetical protein
MPYTQKFSKLLQNTRAFYGYAKGTQVAYATAKKKGWRA